jgi:hypothetical protein
VRVHHRAQLIRVTHRQHRLIDQKDRRLLITDEVKPLITKSVIASFLKLWFALIREHSMTQKRPRFSIRDVQKLPQIFLGIDAGPRGEVVDLRQAAMRQELLIQSRLFDSFDSSTHQQDRILWN